MNAWKKFLTQSVPWLAFVLPVSMLAEKIDLQRVTAVPDGTPIPVMDFFRSPILVDPKLNPSGTHISAIITPGIDHTELMVYNLKTQKIDRMGAPKGDFDIFRSDWLNDHRLLYNVGTIKTFTARLMCADIGDLDTGNLVAQDVSATLIAVPPANRTHPLFRIGPGSTITGNYGEIISFNAENKWVHPSKDYPILKSDSGFDVGYLADKEGNLAFGFLSENGVLSLHQLVANRWVKCPEDLDEIDVIAHGDNPGEIVVLGPRQDGKPRALQILEASTGRLIDTLFQDKGYDFNGWLYHDSLSHNIVGAFSDRGAPHVVWFTEAYQNLQKAVDKLFPGQVVRVLGTSESGNVVLIETFSDRQPALYSWVDLEKHSANLIKSTAPWIDPKRMQPMSLMKFKTRDGRQLDAYLTLPAGSSKQNPPPLVVLPHDGTTGRSTWGFNAEVQFLASRGYAVLQPNYRGSAGYSWMFPKDEEWAYRKMSDDVTDATKTAMASGLVDANRIAIMGTGFGAFLAFEGAAFEPALYRCAIGVSPVLDWAALLQDQKYFQYDSSYFARRKLKLGDPKVEAEKFDAIAPARHADQIRAAVLVTSGEYDVTAITALGENVVSNVKRRNIPAEHISYLNEAEGINHLEHLVDFYSRVETFLAENLKAGSTATPATGSH